MGTFSGVMTAVQTANFKRWFGESKVINPNGTPMVVYHGTQAHEQFTQFRPPRNEIGMHFGTIAQASDFVRAGNPNSRIYKVYLRIVNPLEMRDMNTWNYWQMVTGLEEVAGRRHSPTKDQVKKIRKYVEEVDDRTGDWAQGIQAVRHSLEALGYDGITYLNMNEGVNTDPDADWLYDYSYIVWRPEQIKSADRNNGNFDPSDPDILHGIRRTR